MHDSLGKRLKYRGRVAISLPLLVTTFFLLAACSTGVGNTDTLSVEIDGSSTVAPISSGIVDSYRSDVDSSARISVGISGTGGGFKRFTTGETSISNASRPITESEIEAANANGVEYVELKVGYDGLAVVVNSENTFAACLTTGQLHDIWADGSTIDNWNQINPNFPNQSLDLYGPDEESGTYDYFNEEILDEGFPRFDYSPSSDDNVLVTGVSGSPGGLGYFGLAYYTANSERLRLVAVDDGDGCVIPDLNSIGGGTYSPLSRPLFIYVNKSKLIDDKFYNFVRYYLNNSQSASEQVGYVALPDNELEAELAKLEASR